MTVNSTPWNAGKKLPSEVLRDGEALKLISALRINSSTGIRNAALIAVMWRGGLRCQESLDCRESHLDMDSGLISVVGKGGYHRQAAMDFGGWEYLHRWIERRRSLGLGDKGCLFCTLEGRRLETRYVRAMVARTAKKAGISRRVNSHCLRHTHAYELVQEGWTIPQIQQQLGHRNLSTTSVYLQHVNPGDRVELMRSRRIG